MPARFHGFLRVAFACALLAFPAAAAELAADMLPSPAEMRAEFLINLPLATHWPVHQRQANTKFRLCSLGENVVTGALKQRLMSSVSARVSFEPDISIYRLSRCDILYVPPEEGQAFASLRDRLSGLPVVIVGEGEVFLRLGGMLSFMKPPLGSPPATGPLTFRLCTKNAEIGGIRFEGMLMELAESIRETVP